MDWQSAFNALFTLVGGAIGWILHLMHSEVQDLKQRQEDFRSEVPNVYARRDDVRDRFNEIIRLLERINNKVDNTHGKT